MSGPSDFTLFLGRFHPLLVHLPIALLLLVAVLEALARHPRLRHANQNAGLLLALAAPLAIFTVVCGWLLSLGGGDEPRLRQWHKWPGIATAGVSLVAGLLYWLDLKRLYRLSLSLMVLILLVASHYGGSLTHGSDYLVRYAPRSLRAWLRLGAQPGSAAVASAHPQPARPATPAVKAVDFMALPAYATLVQPIFEKDCVSCHGPEKAKGGLRLDSFENLLKGAKERPALVAGNSGQSELVRRLLLPPENEDHMPPDGKPQPDQDAVALLQWWIDSGASREKTIGELKPPPSIARILTSRFAPPVAAAKMVPPDPLSRVLPLAEKLAADLGISLAALSEGEPWLQCNPSIAGTNFTDAELDKLAPVAANVRWLDLSGTRVTDAGLRRLASMPNLTRLHLERTSITDAGLESVAALSGLEYLDLYGTAVTDTGLARLNALPKLKRLYLWQTKVTPAAAKAFADARTDKTQLQRLQVEMEAIQARIRDLRVAVELGTAVPALSNTAGPANTLCPVSGKAINPEKTVSYEGRLIAFCCDDCKAKFQRDPKPFVKRLGNPSQSSETR